jgi:hypothetical protein
MERFPLGAAAGGFVDKAPAIFAMIGERSGIGLGQPGRIAYLAGQPAELPSFGVLPPGPGRRSGCCEHSAALLPIFWRQEARGAKNPRASRSATPWRVRSGMPGARGSPPPPARRVSQSRPATLQPAGLASLGFQPGSHSPVLRPLPLENAVVSHLSGYGGRTIRFRRRRRSGCRSIKPRL